MKWNKGDVVELEEGLGEPYESRLKNTPRIITICRVIQGSRCDGHYGVDGPLHGLPVTEVMIKGLAVVRGDRVKAWDENEARFRTPIFLNETPGAAFPITTIANDTENEEKFLQGQTFGILVWKHMAPIPPEPEPSEADIVAKLMIRIERLEIGLGNIATSQPWCEAAKELQKIAKDVLEGKA